MAVIQGSYFQQTIPVLDSFDMIGREGGREGGDVGYTNVVAIIVNVMFHVIVNKL